MTVIYARCSTVKQKENEVRLTKFGFVLDNTEVKSEKRLLSLMPWNDISTETKVVSMLTKIDGTIISIDKEKNTLEVSWSNGNTSKASKHMFDKVLCLIS